MELNYIKEAIRILTNDPSRKSKVSMKYINAVSIIVSKEGIVFIHSIFTRNNKTIMIDVSVTSDFSDINYIVAYVRDTKQISVYNAAVVESKDINLTEAEELMLLM